ncbi:MAPEG family protein [Tropicibacter sp. S64]|uniref:MAPEG family protein n=1 Tax=Tropicibacter sp. S64 TaxID=3415122 RepID=UPI003C7D2923
MPDPAVLPVSFTFIGLLAIVLSPLTGWVGVRRGQTRTLRGDGGDPELFRRIRIHGNLLETAPVFALTLAAAESAGLGQGWLWAAVAVFVFGRVLHYRLYDSGKRGVAMVVTLLPGSLMGLWLLAVIWA